VSLTIIEGEEVLNIEETVITNTFNVFPNPVDANGILFLKSKNTIEGDLTLYDTTGKEVVRSTINGDTGQLQVQNVSSGFYILKVETQNSIESLKVIIK